MSWGLALETAASVGAVAIGRGDAVFESVAFTGRRAHAVELLPTIEALCRRHAVEPSAIDAVYVSCGPGSFTGLRIGITAARMLAFSVGARVVPVPTLDVIAQQADAVATPPDRVVVMLDAKRRRVYAAAFRRVEGVYLAEGAAAEVDPARFLADQPRPCAVLGDGVAEHRAVVEASGVGLLPDALGAARAATVYRLGAARATSIADVDPRDVVPTYVRRPEAEERWARRHRADR